jgi:hypothetical protein
MIAVDIDAPGALMRLVQGLSWCNGHVVDGNDNIVAEMHFTKEDVALFISVRPNAWDPVRGRKYRCLVGDKIVLFNPDYLRKV